MKEMHLHQIPWPSEVLQSLGTVEVEMRVTLSYFVEPGPGEKGWKDRYRYPSCGLRFDVINSNETIEDFKKRVNVKMIRLTAVTVVAVVSVGFLVRTIEMSAPFIQTLLKQLQQN